MDKVLISYGYCERCYHPYMWLSTGHEWTCHSVDCGDHSIAPCETMDEIIIVADGLFDVIKPDLN